jgi:predicted DNA binding CopG/RHH family protein
MNKKAITLDKEERALLKAIENSEKTWASVSKNEKKRHIKYANNTITQNRKDKFLNIRISSDELNALKTKAGVEGMPYQTMVSSIIHKYIIGLLIDVNAIRPLFKESK